MKLIWKYEKEYFIIHVYNNFNLVKKSVCGICTYFKNIPIAW